MRGIRHLTFVGAAVAATFAWVSPASAQGAIAGGGAIVGGTVTLSPGFPFGSLGCGTGTLSPVLCGQSFSFSSPIPAAVLVAAGTPSSAGDAVFEGSLTASASGGSLCVNSLPALASGCTGGNGLENVAGGVGLVNTVTASGSGTCIGACWDSSGDHCIGICTFSSCTPSPCTPGPGPVAVSISASLSGVYVRVGPIVPVVLTGTLTLNGYTYTTAATVEALFLPNQLPPATVTTAAFDGAFQVGGVLP